MALSRLEKLEQEVYDLKGKLEEVFRLLSDDTCVSPLATENQKLLYRLNILTRAIECMEKVEIKSLPESGIYSILHELNRLFDKAIKAAYPELTDIPVIVALSNNVYCNSKGIDYQCSSAHPILQALKAKGIKTSPKEIGENILKHLEPHNIINKAEVAPAGFVNIYLERNEGQRLLNLILKNGVQPPRIAEKKRRVVVDFSSPNIAKEMHVGHLRSTIIGDTICRILEYLGNDVLRINHVGDWGTQFGMLIAHLQDEYPDYLVESPPVSDLQAFYKASKQRFDTDEVFKSRAYECVVRLQSGHPDYIKAWQLICDTSRKEFQKVYDRLGVKLTERGESFYQKRMEVVVKELEERKLLIEDEGRKIMWADGIDVPFTVIKSDGGFTYDTSDLATIKQRLFEEQGDWLIYVTDAGQSQHFEILRRIATQVGWMDADQVRMDHVTFGVVLGEDKKKFKTRSGIVRLYCARREGDTVRLVDLLDEGVKRASNKLIEKGRDKVLTTEEMERAKKSVAYGCIKYADLSHNRNQEYVFSFDKMLEDKGNTAVYLLYALTRIKSIARTAGVSVQQLEEASKTTPISLDHEKEWKLAKTILRFPDSLATVTSYLYTHPLCEYVYDIACCFSEFYDQCYCVEKNAQGEIVKVNMGRLLLAEVAARVMETCFQLLGLEPVEKM